MLATATGRDSGAKLGKDIAVIKGSFNSGGSAKNWATIVKEGTVIRMMMPKDLIDDAKDNDIEIKRLNATENNADPANGMATPGVKVDIDSEIESLRSETDRKAFGKRLDDLEEMLKERGLMDKYSPKLEELYDILEEITRKSVAAQQNATADIDSEIESLKQLIGTPEFSDALDRLLDKLEATGLENQYESIVSDIIIQDAQAESAKVGV